MMDQSDTDQTSCEARIRKMHAELNVLSSADGSAIHTQGNTICMASVYGPIECKSQKSMIDKACIELNYKTKSGPPEISDKMNELIIRNICETAILSAMYPRCAVSVSIQEVQNDGSLLACAVNTCCLALLNAAIPLRYLFVAVTCFIDKNDVITLDPSLSDDDSASLTFVFDSIKKNVITSYTLGKFDDEIYLKALFKCQTVCDEILTFYRQLIVKYADKLGKRHMIK